jgi:hypothetical protein
MILAYTLYLPSLKQLPLQDKGKSQLYINRIK